MARQLTLDLPVRAALGREDFFVGPANEAALARLDETAGWPYGKLALVGPPGAGKTHLAHVWAATVGAEVLDAGDLAARDIPAQAAGLAIDRADRVAGDRRGEEALFHLHNHMAASGLPLLLVARAAPARWKVTLPDLESRLLATDVIRIDPPDEALLAAVLVKLFDDRGLAVAPNLIGWLVQRMDRSFAEAGRLVARLDAEALAEGRAVTRRMAARMLEDG